MTALTPIPGFGKGLGKLLIDGPADDFKSCVCDLREALDAGLLGRMHSLQTALETRQRHLDSMKSFAERQELSSIPLSGTRHPDEYDDEEKYGRGQTDEEGDFHFRLCLRDREVRWTMPMRLHG